MGDGGKLPLTPHARNARILGALCDPPQQSLAACLIYYTCHCLSRFTRFSNVKRRRYCTVLHWSRISRTLYNVTVTVFRNFTCSLHTWSAHYDRYGIFSGSFAFSVVLWVLLPDHTTAHIHSPVCVLHFRLKGAPFLQINTFCSFAVHLAREKKSEQLPLFSDPDRFIATHRLRAVRNMVMPH